MLITKATALDSSDPVVEPFDVVDDTWPVVVTEPVLVPDVPDTWPNIF